jgi:hypothetical protein
LRIALPSNLTDNAAIVSRLDGSHGDVVARVEGGEIVVRPERQPTVGGMPAYYTGRPEFRGTLGRDVDGALVLIGTVRRSDTPIITKVLGSVVVGLGLLSGSIIVLSGDGTGALVAVFCALVGIGVIGGGFFIGGLAGQVEETIVSALGSPAEPGAHATNPNVS